MTIVEAIERFESARNNTLALPGRRELIDMALAALRTLQKARENEPLTLGELLKMNGQPVYVMSLTGGRGWYIVDVEYNELRSPWDGITLEDWDEGGFYTAYRRPPN